MSYLYAIIDDVYRSKSFEQKMPRGSEDVVLYKTKKKKSRERHRNKRNYFAELIPVIYVENQPREVKRRSYRYMTQLPASDFHAVYIYDGDELREGRYKKELFNRSKSRNELVCYQDGVSSHMERNHNSDNRLLNLPRPPSEHINEERFIGVIGQQPSKEKREKEKEIITTHLTNKNNRSSSNDFERSYSELERRRYRDQEPSLDYFDGVQRQGTISQSDSRIENTNFLTTNTKKFRKDSQHEVRSNEMIDGRGSEYLEETFPFEYTVVNDHKSQEQKLYSTAQRSSDKIYERTDIKNNRVVPSSRPNKRNREENFPRETHSEYSTLYSYNKNKDPNQRMRFSYEFVANDGSKDNNMLSQVFEVEDKINPSNQMVVEEEPILPEVNLETQGFENTKILELLEEKSDTKKSSVQQTVKNKEGKYTKNKQSSKWKKKGRKKCIIQEDVIYPEEHIPTQGFENWNRFLNVVNDSKEDDSSSRKRTKQLSKLEKHWEEWMNDIRTTKTNSNLGPVPTKNLNNSSIFTKGKKSSSVGKQFHNSLLGNSNDGNNNNKVYEENGKTNWKDWKSRCPERFKKCLAENPWGRFIKSLGRKESCEEFMKRIKSQTIFLSPTFTSVQKPYNYELSLDKLHQAGCTRSVFTSRGFECRHEEIPESHSYCDEVHSDCDDLPTSGCYVKLFCTDCDEWKTDNCSH